jgi:hypothetical protein
MTTPPTPETHEPTAPRWDAPAIAHLTVEEWERVEHLMPAVDTLLGRMAVDGVADPVTVLRAAVDAGRDAAEAPILALARQVDPQAIRWAPEIEYLRVVNDLADGVRLRTVIHACLDRIARVAGERAVRRGPQG